MKMSGTANHGGAVMRRSMLAAALFATVAVSLAHGAWAQEKPVIQLAILLDTSNSMDGLINQAKSQIWKIVNEFATAKRGGPQPELEVALYEYGNDGLSAEKGHIRQVLPLTRDLDKVSEELFALQTNGGSEYCGQVIDVATRELAWSKNTKDLKVIVIAGNEPFDQGSVDFRKSCKAAITAGVIINTIHCGSDEEGRKGFWKDGALLADGQYMFIDSNQAVAHIDAPQDKEIARLGGELNGTYIPYGNVGNEASARQAVQDSNAMSVAQGSSVNRALFKASANYRNEAWDLVDAVRANTVKLEEVKEAELPEEMRKLDLAGRKAYLDKQEKRRSEIQEEIRKLDDERKKFVAAKMKEQQNPDADTFDSAMIRALRKQAESKEFKFE
ncbi:MAG: VWA domain-containing protein [Deltaproteobacteria bacterium]|nr:VWA domain-containing protein [Deltaproteobacteria bacterium]